MEQTSPESVSPVRDFASMTIDELIDAIVDAGLDVPDGLPQEIVKRGSEAVPRLAEILHSEEWWAKDEYPEYWAVVHAMHLLSGIGNPAALDALLMPMRRKKDSDFFFDAIVSLPYRMGPAALDAIAEFIREAAHDTCYRWCAYHGLVGMTQAFPEVKERVIGLGRELVERALAGGEPCPEGIAYLFAGFRQDGDESLLRRLYEEGKVEETFIYGGEEIECALQEGHSEGDLAVTKDDPMSFYTKENLERLDEINAENDPDEYEDWEDDDFVPLWAEDEGPFGSEGGDSADQYLVTPPIFSGERVGRNDPCPCGSGKKYKKCCGKT